MIGTGSGLYHAKQTRHVSSPVSGGDNTGLRCNHICCVDDKQLVHQFASRASSVPVFVARFFVLLRDAYPSDKNRGEVGDGSLDPQFGSDPFSALRQ